MNPIVVVAASGGALPPLLELLAGLLSTSPASVFVVWHAESQPTVSEMLLPRLGGLPILAAEDGAPIEWGRVYIVPLDRKVMLEADRIRLGESLTSLGLRSAADPLFVSAAKAYGSRVIGIVLSGPGSDGAPGLRAIKHAGGEAWVQHPAEATVPSMPLSAIAADHPEILTIQEMASRLRAL